jgi:hypothetical protein
MGRGRRPKNDTDTRWQWPSGGGRAPGLAAFKSACYEIARRTGGHVESASHGRFPPNFHDAVLAYRDRRAAVLCHQSLPLLALAEPPARASWSWPISFVDDPSIGPPLATMLRVRLLTAAELDLDWSRTAAYPPAEVAYRQDMEYWRPGSVGDVIFNSWD